MIVPALFHWSPTVNRIEILRDGLKPHSPPVTHGVGHTFPYLCFGLTPSAAWGLSGDQSSTSEIEEWDLWQVRLADGDDTHVLPFWGKAIGEIRVRNAIPADRVWWVAKREPFSAIEVPS